MDLAARDLDAFCREQYPRLFGLLGLYCADTDLAEELTQETLARVCQNWSKMARVDDPAQWAARVAFNLAKSRFRKRSVRRGILDRYAPALADHRSIDDIDSALAVRAAVARLPERQRRALLLRYFADMPVAEVARTMQCPEGTVKTLTYEAIGALRAAGLEVDNG